MPIRLEIGMSEVKNNQLTIANRITGEKKTLSADKCAQVIQSMLHDIQNMLLAKAKEFGLNNTHHVNSYEEFKHSLKEKRGFISAFWCEDKKCETGIKEDTKATTRCLPLDSKQEQGKCVYCSKEAKNRWLFAHAY